MKKLSWPTALVLIVATLAIVTTILAGPALGLDPETLASVLGTEGVLAALVLGLMRQLLGADEPTELEKKRADRMRTMRPPPSDGALALALIIVAAACSVVTSGCSGGAAAAGPIAITARDVTCRGGRVVCRVVDRVCRGTGGPWVVPRSSEEIATDAASGLIRAEPDEPEGEGEDEASESTTGGEDASAE